MRRLCGSGCLWSRSRSRRPDRGDDIATTVTDDSLDRLAVAAGDNPAALAMLSVVAIRAKLRERAYRLACRARALAPHDPEIGAVTAGSITRTVPAWHVEMVQETVRNDAYAAAIERAVRPGIRVLDIGTGTGLLALLAARAGAGQVTTCEGVAAIAEAATDIVAANGFANRITVRNRQSSALSAEADLGGRVDLIVSEILASELLGEFVLPSLRDAQRRLLKPGGAMIPAAADVRVALAQWSGPALTLGDLCGFDVRAFNRLTLPFQPISLEDPRLTLRSAPATVFGFDFLDIPDEPSGRAQIDLTANADGANGVVQWIRVQLDQSTTYENMPGDHRRSAWYLSFYPLDAPRAAGERVTVHARHTDTDLWIWTGPARVTALPIPKCGTAPGSGRPGALAKPLAAAPSRS